MENVDRWASYHKQKSVTKIESWTEFAKILSTKFNLEFSEKMKKQFLEIDVDNNMVQNDKKQS